MLIARELAAIVVRPDFAPLFSSGTRDGHCSCRWPRRDGLTYGPLGTALAELFPTAVRYTGASLTFNLAGILGASLAPYIATELAPSYGLASVGYYLSAAAVVTLLAQLLLSRRPQPHRATLRNAA